MYKKNRERERVILASRVYIKNIEAGLGCLLILNRHLLAVTSTVKDALHF
jgi:hypothetical protein